MGSLTAERLAEQAVDVGLLTPRQLQDVWGSLGTRSVGVEPFVQVLIRRELLTKYQVDRLMAGEKTAYFYRRGSTLYLFEPSLAGVLFVHGSFVTVRRWSPRHRVRTTLRFSA